MVVGDQVAEALGDAAQLKLQPAASLPPAPVGGRLPAGLRPESRYFLPRGAAYTGLLVAGTILPLSICCVMVFSSACRLAGTLVFHGGWNGASTAPPLASVPT